VQKFKQNFYLMPLHSRRPPPSFWDCTPACGTCKILHEVIAWPFTDHLSLVIDHFSFCASSVSALTAEAVGLEHRHSTAGKNNKHMTAAVVLCEVYRHRKMCRMIILSLCFNNIVNAAARRVLSSYVVRVTSYHCYCRCTCPLVGLLNYIPTF